MSSFHHHDERQLRRTPGKDLYRHNILESIKKDRRSEDSLSLSLRAIRRPSRGTRPEHFTHATR